ncbi:MAG: MarR family transcriptional regulator [Bacilli bacterium]|jgi:DNA-binding MarR family transcriptional regulator|nr:MarR family transcriptional regulator [Bacilli bacterium]
MERSIGLEMRNIGNLVKRRVASEAAIDFHKTTGVHGLIIHYIASNHDQEVYQRDFEKKFSMRRSTISRMLALMESNGMIERIPSKNDARQKQIVLTQKARDKHLLIEKILHGIEGSMRKGISDEEMNSFFATIDKIKANLE